MFDRFSREDRTVLMFAMQEARDLGHPGIGNDHLVLGMLCNARSPLFGLLAEQGLTLDTARAVVRGHHAEHHSDEPAEVSSTTRYDEDREALASIGIDLDRLRAAVRDNFGDDLTDGWGERGRGHRGRRRHRGDGAEPCGPRSRRTHDGPWESGRGRRGPRGRGRARMGESTREALSAAVGIARSRGDDRLRPEHVLLGILQVGDPASRAVIDAATDVDTLRTAVTASLPDPATL